MKTLGKQIVWIALAIVAAYSLAIVALTRGEPINSMWLVLAAACTYLRRVPLLREVHRRARDGARRPAAPRRPNVCATATTSSRPTSGSSSVITSPPSPARGRSSARCSPRSSATCRARSGSSIGAVLGGAVQDFVILFASMRRDGKSLGQMAREEIGMAGRRHGAPHRPADHDHPARRGRAGRGQRARGTARGGRSRSPRRCRSRCSWGCTCATGGPGKVLEVSRDRLRAGRAGASSAASRSPQSATLAPIVHASRERRSRR